MAAYVLADRPLSDTKAKSDPSLVKSLTRGQFQSLFSPSYAGNVHHTMKL